MFLNLIIAFSAYITFPQNKYFINLIQFRNWFNYPLNDTQLKISTSDAVTLFDL